MSAAPKLLAPSEACAACKTGFLTEDENAVVGRAMVDVRGDDVCSACFCRMQDAIYAAGIPGMFIGAHRAHPRFREWVYDQAAFAQALEWKYADALDDVGPTTRLVFQGPTGAGKTTSACAIAHEWIYWVCGRKPRVRFVHAHDLALARRTTKLGRESNLVREALDASLLILDDLGSEPNDFAETISYVIQKRHADEERLIVTTAMTAGEIGARYGGGIERRIFEHALVLEMKRRP